MTDRPKQSLIEDLEAIRKSLDGIAESETTDIPTLDEIVGHRTPTSVNPENPFLSGNSLSELIKIRNEAEAREAERLAKASPVKSVEEILHHESEPVADAESNHDLTDNPDPEQIVAAMEDMFDSWKEGAIREYVAIFEHELRHRLQQDFRELVRNWYREHNMSIPEAFISRDKYR